jgi:hypothetical protein
LRFAEFSNIFFVFNSFIWKESMCDFGSF